MTWSYYPWRLLGKPPVDAAVDLKCENLVATLPANRWPPTLQEMIRYADMSYLSCRILTLSSTAVHPVALYMAGQTIEKYLKAVLIARNGQAPRGHRLTAFAGQAGPPFDDREFIKMCQCFEPFNNAGRYPDHELGGWRNSLDLLAFLDGFVVRCRQIVQMPSNTPNVIAELRRQDGNPVMAAAVVALEDQNHHLDELVDPQAFDQAKKTTA